QENRYTFFPLKTMLFRDTQGPGVCDCLLILFSCLSGVLRLNRATLQTDRQKHRQKQKSPHCCELAK
ncbi:hypothetical protein AAIH27_33160, partial [Pseudomonas aeruginosa]|uniref:hypothetical protein n=1 Tax=Pseudomonas aeruginosa TaxID=287 RepID=UPI0031B765CD